MRVERGAWLVAAFVVTTYGILKREIPAVVIGLVFLGILLYSWRLQGRS